MKIRFVQASGKCARYLSDNYWVPPPPLHLHNALVPMVEGEQPEKRECVCKDCGQAFIGALSSSNVTEWDTEDGKLHPGDAWFVDYFHDGYKHLYCPWDNCNDPRGHLHVMLPDGHMWNVDGRASNCTMKDDKTHRCWVRHGEPPNLHVDKKGHTCSAGAGSILSPLEGHWHGFLHNGELIQC